MKTSVKMALAAAALTLATTRTASAVSVAGGDVPLPAKYMGNGLQSVWDGSYSDLLAADALATCWTTQQDRGAGYWSGEVDGFIESLLTRMGEVSCYTSCSNPSYTNSEDIQICAYLDSRKDPYCNMDPATGQPRALDVSKLRDVSTTAPYALPSSATLGLSGGAAEYLRGFAQMELSYADLTLCMAEQLQAKLDTVQVAFASSDDLFRVQENVRERALTAVYEYSVIGKTLATKLPFPTASNIPYTGWYLIPFGRWLNTTFTSSTATRLGDDFAEAINLLAEATEASVALRMRDPAAQSKFGDPNWDPSGTFNGLGGPRADVIAKILYEGYDDSTLTTKRRAVLTDTSDPHVGVLLGLARNANALKLHVNAPPQFSSAANASTLLLAVENFVRKDDCTRRGIAASACPLATSTTAPTAYFLWQRYGINLSHAQALVDSLTEAMFGPPTPASRASGQWSYPSLFAAGVNGPSGPAEQLTMHLFGKHAFSGDRTAASPTGDITIDPTFTVGSPRALDIQSMRTGVYLPVRDVNPADYASYQIGWFRYNPLDGDDRFGYPTDRRQLGSSTVLALAREALMQLSQATNASSGIYTEAAPTLGLIEKMIGPRQAILRQQLTYTPSTSVCPTCVYSSPTQTTTSGVTTNSVTLDILTKSTDPYNRVAIAPGVPLAATLVQDAATTTIFNNTQANAIANLTYATPTSTTLPSPYVQLSTPGTWLSSSARGVSIVLKTGTGTAAYEHVFTGNPIQRAPVYGRFGSFGVAVTFGGRFEREVTDAWKFDSKQWSEPKLDGFGLPHDWAPAADASLLGTPGVSIEGHFLDRATTAANESALALQQAFDTLQQEALDDASVLSSDQKAKDLTNIERKGLCGPTATCTASYTKTAISIPACSPSTTDCESFRTLLGGMVGTPTSGTPTALPLASAVATEISAGTPAPTFSAYSGGTLQSLFIDQWNAWQQMGLGLKSAVASTQSAIAQVTAATADVNAATADYNSVQADITAAYAQLTATNAMLAAQQTMYNAQKTTYDAQLTSAQTSANTECGPGAFDAAYKAGWSWSGDEDMEITGSSDANGWNYHIHDYSNRSWSSSAVAAQMSRCQGAQNALTLATTTTQPQKDSMDALIAGLQKAIDASTSAFAALPTRLAAAEAHKESAASRLAAAQAGVASQEATSAQNVQTTLGQLLTSIASIDGAFTQSDLATAKIAVDQQQATYDVRARFGVRARYHSYDLWRARALTENARRLALAARRAIESRYVVDLSTLNASEPFVEAPALWADQVYAADLKPFSIGLTAGPTSGSGLYANAVKDYVNNLSLFLDGFTIARPSAAVLSDSEVIQVPGPAAQVVTSSHGASYDYIDPTSSGWSFYCPATDTWIADPDVGKFVSGTPAWTLATACGGSAPTMARYGFSLDPWGRAQGSVANPPYAARYNVRTRGVALNLVGSGIRSCEKAPDPSACYAEPFIRYDLKHIGPAWVTSYDQTWRSLDIPRAKIEAAKALASEEWLDPVTNGFNRSDVNNITRSELAGRPIGGAYELTLYLTPDVNVERIERIQLLAQSEYWVRQD